MQKKRILLDNEASFLATGYSNYGREVLKRLHATGKYEIAEFASYGHWSDERQYQFPWRFYGNMPNPGDKEQNDRYNSNPLNQFGLWRFNEVCLDYKPHIVFSFRDFWMDNKTQKSPLRRFYKFAHVCTCDSDPQPQEWVDMYNNVDALFTYTDWAKEVLKKQGVNALRSHPPGVDINTFKPIQDRDKLKELLGIEKDTYIIGTVMRNQKRKLYPDLIAAFSKFINKYKDTEIGKKSYLLLYVSHPDLGWDITKLIKDSDVSHRILLVYICKKCGKWFPSLFHDARQACRYCHASEAVLPNTQVSLPADQLNLVYNIMSEYIQVATREGIGMPQLEAAAAGVKVLTVNYSGCVDIINKLKAIPIKVKNMVCESETMSYGAYFDEDDLIRKMYEYLSLPKTVRMKQEFETAQLARKHYNYDNIAKLWEEYFDSVDVSTLPDWDTTPPKIFQAKPQNIPQNINSSDFVRLAMLNILGEYNPSDYMVSRLVRDLNYGASTATGGLNLSEMSLIGIQNKWKPFTPQDVINELININSNSNYWELERVKKNRIKPDYIQHVHNRFGDA